MSCNNMSLFRIYKYQDIQVIQDDIGIFTCCYWTFSSSSPCITLLQNTMSSTPWTLDGCILLSAPASLVCSQCSCKEGTEQTFVKYVLFSYVMALFKAVVWALIFLTKLRFPPGVSIAIVLKDGNSVVTLTVKLKNPTCN